jgi:hypothetical protein
VRWRQAIAGADLAKLIRDYAEQRGFLRFFGDC